jgi:hypothetical protein
MFGFLRYGEREREREREQLASSTKILRGKGVARSLYTVFGKQFSKVALIFIDDNVCVVL